MKRESDSRKKHCGFPHVIAWLKYLRPAHGFMVVQRKQNTYFIRARKESMAAARRLHGGKGRTARTIKLPVQLSLPVHRYRPTVNLWSIFGGFRIIRLAHCWNLGKWVYSKLEFGHRYLYGIFLFGYKQWAAHLLIPDCGIYQETADCLVLFFSLDYIFFTQTKMGHVDTLVPTMVGNDGTKESR